VKELKAVFFVKDFTGNPGYNERKDFAGNQQSVGRKMEVTFSDGEVLVGSTMGHDPKRPGFSFILQTRSPMPCACSSYPQL